MGQIPEPEKRISKISKLLTFVLLIPDEFKPFLNQGPSPSESSRPSGSEESGFTVINKQAPSGCFVDTPKADASSAKASGIASGLEGLEGYGSDSENEDQVCFH